MKIALAVLFAFIFMLLGWLILGGLLYGVLYVASHASKSVGLMHLLNLLLIWIVAPGFGGFLATYVTPRLFTKVDVRTVAVSVISIVMTLAISLAILALIFLPQSKALVGQFILFFLQVTAIIVGARIGKNISVPRIIGDRP